jgi:pyruvate dehydrogenase E2 component (dihydrolipoamide acetyltransferase)
MGYVVRMPKLGLEMEEGTVLEWTVDEGEEFAGGDQIAEVESEKSVGEVEAREDGVLRRVYLAVDDTVPPSTPMGIVAAPDADISDLESEAEADLESEAPEEAEPATATGGGATAEADAGGGSGAAAGSGGGSAGADVRASPRAEKRAEELGVDLTSVEGSGPGGAITADDVEAAAESGAAGEAGTEPADVRASPRAEKRVEELGVDLTAVEGTGPGGAITADDVEAAAEAGVADEDEATEVAPGGPEAGAIRRIVPEDETSYRYGRATAVADGPAATALFETTEAVRSAFEERVTMTDVLAVVASAALGDHPEVNATYAGGTHQLQEARNLALVVDVAGDPTAGVIPGAGELSVTELVEARQELEGDGEAVPTFTLANAGDAESAGLLVNEPAVAALEVDPTGQRAVPSGDGVDLRPLVTASLTYDTRALDADDARGFLSSLFDHAESAPELVLGSYRGGE